MNKEILPNTEASRSTLLTHYCMDYDISPTPGVDLCHPDTQVTVVIPAFNEQSTIGETLWSLGQSEESIEIVVVDNGSEDDTQAVVADVAKEIAYPVTVLDQHLQGPVYARKKGMDEVVSQYLKRGDISKPRYIAMTDADTVVPPNWAMEIVQTFHRTNAAALGGLFRYPEDLDPLIEQTTGVSNFFGEISRAAFFLTAHNAALVSTYGPNTAIEVAPYAAIGGSQQPCDAAGNQVKGSDKRFGNAVRALGQTVGFLPAVVETSPRREIYSLSKREPQRVNSSMQGWVNCRGQDKEQLKTILPYLDPADMQRHKAERMHSFLHTVVLLPILDGKLSVDGLSTILGPENDLIRRLGLIQQQSYEQAERNNLAKQLAYDHSNRFFDFLSNVIEPVSL